MAIIDSIKKLLKDAWQLIKKFAVKVLNFFENIVAWFKKPDVLEQIKNNEKIIAVSIKEKLVTGDYSVINCLYDKEEDRLIDASENAVVFTANSLDSDTLSRFDNKEMIILQ